MWRRTGAAVAVLAILYGFSAAPYTHAHHAIDSAGDERHPHGDTLVHTHASPHAAHAGHSEPDASGRDHRDERIWSVDSFVFQQTVQTQAPFPVIHVFGEVHVRPSGTRLTTDRPQRRTHGPPVGSPSGLRAPPASLPSFA